MTDYEESYEQQLEGVGHPPTTVYRVSTHHAFQEHNGSSSSRSPSLGSPSADSTESNPPAVAEVRDTQQAVRHWTYEEQFRQVRVRALLVKIPNANYAFPECHCSCTTCRQNLAGRSSWTNCLISCKRKVRARIGCPPAVVFLPQPDSRQCISLEVYMLVWGWNNI